MKKHQAESRSREKQRDTDYFGFNFKPGNSPSRKWLRLLYILWPAVSILFNTNPLLRKFILNKLLGDAENIYARVKRIRLTVFRPECIIQDVCFHKSSAPGNHILESSAELIRISFDRQALRSGLLVLDTTVHKLSLYFSPSKKPGGNEKDKKSKAGKVKLAVPVIVKQFNVTDGHVEFNDTTHAPEEVSVTVNNIKMQLTNLSTLRSKEELPTTIYLSADAYNGILTVNLKANILEHQPAFDMDAELTNVKMTGLNNFFNAYGNFDVNEGILSLYTEVAGKDGKYKGYIKPVIRNLDVVGTEDKQESFLHQVWENIVGAAAALIKNQEEDQLATKISFEGRYKPHIHIGYAIIETLINAFVQALKPSIDYEINIGSVKTSKQA